MPDRENDYLEQRRRRQEQQQNQAAAGLSQGAMAAIRDFQAQGGQLPPEMASALDQGGQLPPGAMDAMRDFQAQGGQIPPAMMAMLGATAGPAQGNEQAAAMRNGEDAQASAEGAAGPADEWDEHPGLDDTSRSGFARESGGQEAWGSSADAAGGRANGLVSGGQEAWGRSMDAAGGRANELAAVAVPVKVTREKVMRANDILKRYKAGKAKLEDRLVANEKWWDARAWNVMQERGNHLSAKRPTMWLFNVIMGKHADMIEAFPEPVILPREEGDKDEAKRLTSILPVVLEQNHFDEVYSLQAWEKNKHGTGCYGIFWDQSKLNGMGDISIAGVDLLNLFWEPDIQDIQDSQNVFLVTAQDVRMLKERYPQLEGQSLESDISVKQYDTEDKARATEKALVVDWYYHTYEGGQKRLQYCKYVGTNVLYASEDDPNLQGRGWYDDGEYPFVLDRLYPIKGSPAGRGYIDLGRNAQEEIDLLSQAISINSRAGAIPRWLVTQDASINEEEFLDFTKPFVHVQGGSVNEHNTMLFPSVPLNGNYLGVLQQKIEELKQTTGNQDVTNGITSGVTAASGIAAQMEAAGRSSRDSNQGTYRAYSRILLMVIERIRQFYDFPRQFRILGRNGQMEFTSYDNSGLQMQPQDPVGGEDMGLRKPLFDIQVSAQKQNPYSKMGNNELMLQLLNAGVFTPQMADQSQILLSMMDFPKRDELLQKVESMSTTQQQLAYFQQIAMQLAKQFAPEMLEEMAQAVMAGAQGQPTGAAGGPAPEMPEEGVQEDSRMRKAREQSRQASQV